MKLGEANYATYVGPVPRNLLLEAALRDPCEDVRKLPLMMGRKTWRGSGETWSTKHGLISGYEDQDSVRDED